ncbi:hypothetical protein CFRS1_v013166 [Colletotrichum fructicola]|nr:hypothetical protein CFRS1_v013166 [Colletotrichum fructicola]
MASQPAAGPSQGPNGLLLSMHNLPKTPPPPTSLPPRPRGLTPPPIRPLGRGPRTATAALQQAREGRALQDEALDLLAKGLDALIGTAPARLKATAQDLINSFARFATSEISGPTPSPGPGKTYAQAAGGSTRGGPLSGPTPGPRPNRTTGRQATNNTNKPKQTQDLRLLVRLPAEHIPTSRTLAPHSVKMVVTKELNLQPQDLVEVRHTATGFSLRPQNKEIQALLLQRAPEIKNCLTAEKVEVPTKWYQYNIPFCPLYFTSLDGSRLERKQPRTSLLRQQLSSKRPRPPTPTQDSIVVADTASMARSSSSMDEDETEDSDALPLTNRPIRPLPSSSRSQRVAQKPDYNVINAYTHLDLDSEQ